MADDVVLGTPLRRHEMPVIFILDCSGHPDSAKGEALNYWMRETLAEIGQGSDENPSTAIMIGVIAYGTTASWHLSYPTPIGEIDWVNVGSKGGSANLAEAVDLAASTLRDLPQGRYIPPILCLVSDSAPDDIPALETSMKALDSSTFGKRAHRWAVGFANHLDNPEMKASVGIFTGRPEEAMPDDEVEELHPVAERLERLMFGRMIPGYPVGLRHEVSGATGATSTAESSDVILPPSPPSHPPSDSEPW